MEAFGHIVPEFFKKAFFITFGATIPQIMKLNKNLLFIALIAAAMLTRFLPHAPNFTAVGAAAIFGGFAFKNNFKAFLVPLLAMFLSDLVLNNLVYGEYYEGFVFFSSGFAPLLIYAALFISVLFGKYFTNGFKALPLLGAGLASALVFYLLTNFGAWLFDPMYTKDFTGLMASYLAGLPFLANQAAGTVVYGAVIFGAAYIAVGSKRTSAVNA